jgi:tRNA threonylcarbamoyladenosine biosynthesis protein TsaB
VLILAIETSAQAGSVALLTDESLVTQVVMPTDRRSAQSLAPAIDQLLRSAGVKPAELGLVATTIGPGSFTGLRVGVTTAKTLAYAVGCQCLGVDTLEVIALQQIVQPTAAQQLAELPIGELHVVLDAQRKELFLARFRLEGEEPVRVGENTIVPAGEWLASLTPGTLVSGPGLARLVDKIPAGVVVAPAELREPTAVAVGQLAHRDYERGRRDDLWKLMPHYLRPSAAEEKAGRKPG